MDYLVNDDDDHLNTSSKKLFAAFNFSVASLADNKVRRQTVFLSNN